MFTTEDIARIRAMVSEVTGQPLPQAHVTQTPGLSVTLRGGNATVAAEDRNALARGFFLIRLVVLIALIVAVLVFGCYGEGFDAAAFLYTQF